MQQQFYFVSSGYFTGNNFKNVVLNIVVIRLINLWECNRGDWGSVLVCLKPKSVVAESNKSVEVKNLFVCVKQT